MADNILGDIVGGIFGLGGTKLGYDEARKLAEQQNQYNIDMWKMNNAYNSPQAQMKRFAEAGLNPNLIYSQGTSGNSSSPPQQVTAQAPDYSKAMSKIGQAFNIEGLRMQRAERQKAESEAMIAKIEAYNARDERNAQEDFSKLYDYDPVTGSYVFHQSGPHDVSVTREMTRNEKRIRDKTGALSTRVYNLNKLRENNFYRNHLIPYRAGLLELERQVLAPQVSMRQYESRFYPYSYWIGQGSRVLNAATGIPQIFSPLKWVPKPGNVINRTYSPTYIH